MSYFRETEATKRQPSLKQIFEGVKVYVCKNLLMNQVEMYEIVQDLGGDFRWNYSEEPFYLQSYNEHNGFKCLQLQKYLI